MHIAHQSKTIRRKLSRRRSTKTLSAASLMTALFLIIPTVSAKTISLSGKIVDEAGAPVSGVDISLIQAGISTTSGPDGTFLLKGSGVRHTAYRRTGQTTVTFHGNTMQFGISTDQARVSVHAFNCRGGFLASVVDSLFPSGTHAVGFNMKQRADGMTLLQVKIGSRVETARYVQGRFTGVSRLGTTPQPAIATAKGTNACDTLTIAGTDFMTKRLHVEKFDTSLGEMVLFEKNLGLTTATYPRVDGSTSAHPLGVIIACRLLNTSYGWDTYVDGTRRAQAYSTQHPGRADSINTNIVIHNGTHGSYVNLIEKEADCILTARMPSEDELQLAASKGVELDPQPVAYDGFVFIVNSKNPVDSLGLETVRGIYTGAVTRWDSIGGPPWNIQPYQRNANSGSQELMLSMVMKGTPIINAPNLILRGMMGPINRLPEDSAGIAYTVYFFKSFMAPHPNIKMIGLNGVMPTFETIQNKSYPLWNEVYAVIRKGERTESSAYRLRRLLRSPEGQDIVRESGYVTLGIDKVR